MTYFCTILCAIVLQHYLQVYKGQQIVPTFRSLLGTIEITQSTNSE